MDFEKAFLMFADFIFADKGYFFNNSMRFERIDKAIEMNNTVLKMPIFIRSTSQNYLKTNNNIYICRNLIGYMIIPFSKLTAAFLHAGKETIPQMWALNGQKDQITYKMMREWDSQGFDAIISCPFPMPAISPDFCSKIISGVDKTRQKRRDA